MSPRFVSAEKLAAAGLCRVAPAALAAALDEACARFEITTGARLAGFLAQCSHESEGFTHLQENLNYRAQTLIKVWPSHFNEENAAAYSHQPEKIASRAYAGHLGNGPETSGDGWRFRGRGFIQLTGRANYAAFGAAIGEDVLKDPDAVAAPRLAALSAAWFWKRNGLNALADARDVVGMTKRINGGTIGLDERRRLYAQASAVFV